GFLPARENRSPAWGLHPEPAACVRDAGKKETRCATCPPQACSAQARAVSLPGGTQAQRGLASGKNRVRARRGEEKTRCASCSAQPRAFSLPGKTEAQCGPAHGTNRVRARFKCRHKHGARVARRSRAGKKQTGQTALWAADTL